MGLISCIQGRFNIQISSKLIHHINKLKKKNYMIISINAENAFNKIQHLFMIKTVIKLEQEGYFFNLKRTFAKKSTIDIIFNDIKYETPTYSPKLGARQGCPILPFLFCIILEVLANAVGQEKETKPM